MCLAMNLLIDEWMETHSREGTDAGAWACHTNRSTQVLVPNSPGCLSSILKPIVHENM
jgi:hypothetical protein